jgi:hypothetical protein
MTEQTVPTASFRVASFWWPVLPLQPSPQTAAAQPEPPPGETRSAADPTSEGEVLLRITVNGQARAACDRSPAEPARPAARAARCDVVQGAAAETAPAVAVRCCSMASESQRVCCASGAVRRPGDHHGRRSVIGGVLSPIQAAFIRHGASDCGFCTPGQVVAAQAILRESVGPGRCGDACGAVWSRTVPADDCLRSHRH